MQVEILITQIYAELRRTRDAPNLHFWGSAEPVHLPNLKKGSAEPNRTLREIIRISEIS